MPFNLPTVKALANRAARVFRSDLKGSDAFLWPNNVAVSAKVIAGAVWEAFSFLDHISRQILVHTATDPYWIERHAAEFGMARLPATYAAGKAVIFGDSAQSVPAGIVLQRADGVRYEVVQGGTTGGDGKVEVSVRCLTPGKIGNAVAGVSLSMIVPMSRLQMVAEVASTGIGAGSDTESTESLRQRVWFRKRMPPHGGAAHDYVAWAREINGVTRVFVDPVTFTNARTSVGVWFLMDTTYPNGIPQLSDVAVVAAYIESVRPAGALVEVARPIAKSVDFEIALAPDTLAVRDAVRAELHDLIEREGRVSTLAHPFVLRRSKIIEAISIATGEEHHELVVPDADVTFAVGEVPIMGAVVFA